MIKAILLFFAYLVLVYVASYSRDVGITDGEYTKNDHIEFPDIEDLYRDVPYGTSVDLHKEIPKIQNYVDNEICTAYSYFSLRNNLEPLRKTGTGVGWVSLLCSIVLLRRVSANLIAAGLTEHKFIVVLITCVAFICGFLITTYFYRQTLPLPKFHPPHFSADMNQKEINMRMIIDHYSHLRFIEKTIRRRHAASKIFTVIYFVCFFATSRLYY